MGTRGLTQVIHKQKFVIAQYGQWDHYPSGQGLTALHILQTMDFEKFKNQLEKCRFTTEEDEKKINEFSTSIGSPDGWMSQEQATLFDAEYPYFTRNLGAEILEKVYQSEDSEILLQNSSDYENEAEGVFTINMDDMTYNVRHYDLDITFDLNNLPTELEYTLATKYRMKNK